MQPIGKKRAAFSVEVARFLLNDAMKVGSPVQTPKRKYLGLLLALTVTGGVIVGHAFFLDFKADPRMVLQPWLLQNGFVQYVHIADEHAPLLPQLLAWLTPFFSGDVLLTARTAHVTLLGATCVMVMLWVADKRGYLAALASGLFFWAWSIYFGASVLWHNLALSPLYFLFFVILVKPWEREAAKAVILGLLAGTAILVKQHAVLLILVYLLWVAWMIYVRRRTPRQAISEFGLYVFGAFTPIAVYILYYVAQGGTLSAFLYWFLLFNLESNYAELGRLFPRPHDVMQIAPAFILVIPFLASIRHRTQDQPFQLDRLFLFLLLLVALVFQYPRYSFAHWAVVLPFVSALSGLVCGDWLVSRNSGWEIRSLYVSFVLLWLLQGVAVYWPYWRGERSQQIIRYDELEELASLISPHLSDADEMVIVPNNEAVDNLYYLLRRRPPRYWVMHYPWFANEFVMGQWIEALETDRPKILLFFDKYAGMLLDWPEIARYVDTHYDTAETLTWEGESLRLMQRRE